MSSLSSNVGVVSDTNVRETNEDRHIVMPVFRNNKSEALYGVLDGHGGTTSVEYVANAIPVNFTEALSICDSVKDAFVYCLKKTDYFLLKDKGNSGVGMCGCTVVLCFIKTYQNGGITKLFTANCGDSRAVVCRKGGKAQRLSYDHKSTDENEIKRVKNMGGMIFRGRVEGALAVSRSLGDHDFKKVVVCDPFYSEIDVLEGDSFLILACDGLWDVLSDQEAVDLVKDETSPQLMANKLLKTAIDKGSVDNITIVVVLLAKSADSNVVPPVVVKKKKKTARIIQDSSIGQANSNLARLEELEKNMKQLEKQLPSPSNHQNNSIGSIFLKKETNNPHTTTLNFEKKQMEALEEDLDSF